MNDRAVQEIAERVLRCSDSVPSHMTIDVEDDTLTGSFVAPGVFETITVADLRALAYTALPVEASEAKVREELGAILNRTRQIALTGGAEHYGDPTDEILALFPTRAAAERDKAVMALGEAEWALCGSALEYAGDPTDKWLDSRIQHLAARRKALADLRALSAAAAPSAESGQ